MKKIIITLITFLLAFTASMEAQYSYVKQWHDWIGPWNVTIQSEYNFPAGAVVIRRAYINGAAFPAISWVHHRDDTLIGTGSVQIDRLSITLSTSLNGYGWDVQVRFVDLNYNPLRDPVNLVGRVEPLPPPDVRRDDVVYGNPPSIWLEARVFTDYAQRQSRPAYYKRKLYCRLWRVIPAIPGFVQTREWNVPLNSSPARAYFELPNATGRYCFVWWYTDHDTSLDSHFGEITVWRSDTLCFSLGSVGLEDDLSSIEEDFMVYPNPFEGDLTIVSPEVADFTVHDVTGKLAHAGKLWRGTNRIDLSALRPGVYIITSHLGHARIVKE